MLKHLISLVAFLTAGSAQANDSNSAIGLGGLELIKNEAISMDREDLFISEKQIRVKYQFTNTSDKDVDLLISFPLPAIPDGIGGYMGDVGYPDWNELDFHTRVDGKPAELTRVDVVSVNGKPVATRLTLLGWPVAFWNDYKFLTSLNDLPQQQKDAFIAEGLIRHPQYDSKSQYVEPAWTLTTNVTRTQKFLAGKTVIVEHSYKPVAGGSIAGNMERSTRHSRDLGFAEYAKHYCIDKNFITAFDKIRYAKIPKGASEDEIFQATFYAETWIGYVLKSGANWRGPIKDFRLVVDKGTPNNLVSFCMDGVKRISPTQFEIRKTNYEPAQDLDILIVEWPKQD